MNTKDIYIKSLEEANRLLTERLERETIAREVAERSGKEVNDLLNRYKSNGVIMKYGVNIQFNHSYDDQLRFKFHSRDDVTDFFTRRYGHIVNNVCKGKPTEIQIVRYKNVWNRGGIVILQDNMLDHGDYQLYIGFGDGLGSLERRLFPAYLGSICVKTMGQLVDVVVSYLRKDHLNEK